MAEDYSISAKITADTSGFEKGIDKAQKASKNLSKSVSGVIQGLGKNGLVGALGAVGLAGAGLSVTLGTIVKVAKKVSQTIDECSEAYRKQYQAEVALATAVNNNPYVDGTATKRLKDFASEIQRVSDVGDEELLPMMAQLIATGRTEEETMKIMSVALDMSASGAMSLDTAITQLNATLNGNVGRLGQQNSELKDLTEEELKQGKAVEILGAKYKGLAQTTADSQKQLKNAIGDLKENLGQVFETALAPMRRYFTEVITNLNNSITKSRELKGAMKEVFGGDDVNLEASTDALNIAFSEVLHKQQEVTKNYQQYIQLYGKYIDVATDETALSYKAQISDLNAQLKAISEELNKRRKESEEEKKKLAQAKADEERQKELEKQKEIEAEKLKIQTEWQDKLFAIRIENLERTRERELDNDELTEEQKVAISKFYGDQILAMKIKQIEKERYEALKDEKLTDEAREALILYYENRITQAKDDEEKKRLKAKKEALEEEQKEEEKSIKETLKAITEYTKQYSRKIIETFKKVVSTIKNIFSSGINLFQKLFDINPDEILNNILKVEDNILTFFVETLPKMPSLIESIMQSISVLVGNIRSVVKAGDIRKIVRAITKTITDNLPQIVSDMLIILEEVIDGLIDGLIDWLDSDAGLEKLLKLILQIQKSIEKIVSKALTKLIDMLDKNKDVFSKFLADSMASANKTLPVLLKAIVQLITILIEAIAGAFSDNNFVNSIVESIEKSIKAIIPMIPRFINAIIQLVVNIISALIPYLPQIIMSVVTAIGDALPSMAGQIAGSLSKGIAKIFKSIFTTSFWNDVFSSMGSVILEIIKASLSTLDITSILGLGSSGGSSNVVGNTASKVEETVEYIKESAKNATTGGGYGKNSTGSTAGDLAVDLLVPFGFMRHFANGSNAVSKGLALVGEAGPELVRFRGGEQVLNNRNTNKALADMGKSTNNFNVTFNNLQDTTAFAMMNQLKQYNRQMAINGVI